MNIKETIYAEIERIRSEAVMASFGNGGIDIARHFYELGLNARKEDQK